MLPGGALNLRELEELAREKLSAMAYAYYASGALEEATLRENVAAWARLPLHYKVLVDVSVRDMATAVLGAPVSMPLLVAPTAFHRLAGELATVRAAAAEGTVMILSSLSNTRIEEVCAAAAGSPVWFQLYVYRDRAATAALVARAEAAGASAIVLTVDAPILGRRERDVRNQFHLPEGLRVENMSAVPGHAEVALRSSASGLAAYFAEKLDPSLSWRDVAWLKSVTRLPLVVKGLVRPDDARRAMDHGASAVVVSNHGGRQLDGSPATARVLGAVADAVQERIEVYVDGGVRRGADVLRALSLGARAALIGRPILWGLATGGESGARAVLATFRAELDQAMTLAGCPSVHAVGRDLVGLSKGAS
ncbi:MAG TPA: alpha-hydroxy acid oxidase [Polyangiaceae bacterium]|jgi:4-hydroxymandelate oxidase|nr:alpha-hydroxy acid oxidase [Polyangiaceae bacterium]